VSIFGSLALISLWIVLGKNEIAAILAHFAIKWPGEHRLMIGLLSLILYKLCSACVKVVVVDLRA